MTDNDMWLRDWRQCSLDELWSQLHLVKDDAALRRGILEEINLRLSCAEGEHKVYDMERADKCVTILTYLSITVIVACLFAVPLYHLFQEWFS